ncbi:MAG TPA: DUF6607 family protein [Methylomirabilota bacterium]|nr:DUF6607 family protein [Methylomirabilota bacterium]
MRSTLGLLLLLLAWLSAAGADETQLARGQQAVQSMTGCYLVDYSYVEVESLRPGYARDPRVYDVNRDKSAKEWITAEALSPRRIRLQRILFLSDLGGGLRAGTEIRHQSEDWEYEAPFLYDFVAPLHWQARDLRATPGLWTRRVTNLDDGLRYQCAARWSEDRAYPEWSCSNYAPIPGRETRDMGRSDYQTLQRGTRIVVYGAAKGGSWLERQDNVKTIHDDSGRTPLVRELGKTWYVRLPDSECAAGRAFAERRQAFWALLRETWDGLLDGTGPFVERAPPGQPPRFVRMFDLEDDALGRDLSDPAIRQATRARILEIIREYRAP